MDRAQTAVTVSGFVEYISIWFLLRSGTAGASLENLILVVFDANTTDVAYNITYDNSTALNTSTGVYVQHIDEVHRGGWLGWFVHTCTNHAAG